MQPNDQSRNERIDESLEAERQMRRRERALLRAPVTKPADFSAKEVRRFAREAKEELLRRG